MNLDPGIKRLAMSKIEEYQRSRLLSDPMNVHIVETIKKREKRNKEKHESKCVSFRSRNVIHRFLSGYPEQKALWLKDLLSEIPLCYSELNSRTSCLSAAGLLRKGRVCWPSVRDDYQISVDAPIRDGYGNIVG